MAALKPFEKALLAAQLGERGRPLAENLRNLLQLKPADPIREQRILETALRGNSLDKNPGVAFNPITTPAPRTNVPASPRVLDGSSRSAIVTELEVEIEELSTEDREISVPKGREEAAAAMETGGSGAFMALGAAKESSIPTPALMWSWWPRSGLNNIIIKYDKGIDSRDFFRSINLC